MPLPFDAESSRPRPSGETPPEIRAGLPRRRTPWVGLVLLAAVLIGLPAYCMAPDFFAEEPVDVVEDFFAAVLDRDIDEALSYLAEPPTGEDAAFLVPDAVADGWKLISAKPSRIEPDQVRTVIGDGEERASTNLTVTGNTADGYLISGALTRVRFRNPGLTYLRANDAVVEPPADRGSGTDGGVFEYPLLPGAYTFFGTVPGAEAAAPPEPVLVVHSAWDASTPPVTPPKFTATAETTAAVEDEVTSVIDECASFTVGHASGCPFGVNRSYRGEGFAVSHVRQVQWRVLKPPAVSLEWTRPDSGDDRRLTIAYDEPGAMRLSAEGYLDGEYRAFTVDCAIAAMPYLVRLRPDGSPEPMPEPVRVDGPGDWRNACTAAPEAAK